LSDPIIQSESQLNEYIQRHNDCKIIGFDTEFISEDTYRPELCLIQVNADHDIALIDPYEIADLTPFWQWLTDPNRTILVHACREELRFIYQATKQAPQNLMDIQIAAAFVGLEYPASYGTLTNRLLEISLNKGETRTDWRRRPLTDAQSKYARQDVEYLEPIYNLLMAQLDDMDRTQWLYSELRRQQDHILDQETSPRWRKVSGSGSLNRRGLEIVKQLWLWRDAIAKESNTPPRRILRDDLICELARRQSDSLEKLRLIRGMQHRQVQKRIPAIQDTLRQALDTPAEDCPQRQQKSKSPQRTTLSQFLFTAISDYCQRNHMSPGLVTTMTDLRDYLDLNYGHSNQSKKRQPLLSTGWRKDFIEPLVQDILSGRLVAHVTDPTSDQPLSFEPHSAINPNDD
jgi:ribonuclease D